MSKKIGFIVLLSALSGAALALPTPSPAPGPTPPPPPTLLPILGGPTPVFPLPRPKAAPEFDVASTAAGLTLVLGGLAVLRARRARSPKK